MKLDRFLTEGTSTWQELESLTVAAKGRPERLGPAKVRRLAHLYRRTVAELALARRTFPHDPIVGHLEGLVARARPLVYAGHDRRRSALRFFSRDYWRLIRERPGALGVSAVALLLPLLAGGIWGHHDPASAVGMVPNSFRGAMEPRTQEETDLGLSVEDRFAFAGLIFTNNVRVAFMAFAAGIAAGIGTVLVLLYNGTFIGVLTGMVIGAGSGAAFFTLVLPHGVLELSCIIVTGAAGLRLGWALVDPGPRSRLEALVDEARPAMLLLLGTAPWIVLAGFVEGLVTPTGLGLGGAVILGCALGLTYWGLVAWRGAPVTSGPTP